MRLLNASNFFLGMAYRSVVFLVVLLDQLIVLLLVVEFLAVAGDSGLAGVDGSLEGGYHSKQVSIFLGVSDVVKPRVL